MPTKKVERKKVVLYRVTDDNDFPLKPFSLYQAAEVEETDKMIYFGNHDRFSNYHSVIPLDDANRLYGRTAEEALKKTIAITETKIEALQCKIDKIKANLDRLKQVDLSIVNTP